MFIELSDEEMQVIVSALKTKKNIARGRLNQAELGDRETRNRCRSELSKIESLLNVCENSLNL